MKEINWIQDRLDQICNCISYHGIEDDLINAKDLVLQTRQQNKKIIFAGNGASTTIASHAALDFMNQLAVESYCFNDPNMITANANDFGYDEGLSRYIKLTAKDGDLIVLISSSGMSPNIINAAVTAKKLGCEIITLSGFNKNNTLKKCGNVNLWVDSKEYNIVECVHNAWLVLVCDLIVKDEQDKVGTHGRIL